MSTTEDQQNQNIHQPKKRKTGFAGNLYEVKLISLYICRGINLDYEFEIGTEIEEGGKFDDIIFKYIDKSKKYCIMVQAKHKSDVNEKIVIDHLLIEHFGDFGLSKYYYSYQRAKCSPFFNDHTIQHAIIITNRTFDERRKISKKNPSWKMLENIKNIVEEVTLNQENRVLSLAHDKNKGKIYRFKIDIILPALKHALIEYTLKMIATELLDSLMDKKNRTEYFIEKYYHILIEEVIDPATNQFRPDFIHERENDSAELKQFRIELKSWMKKKNLNLETILEHKEKRFNFMNAYEPQNENKRRNFAELIDDDDVEEFLKIFVIATEQPSEMELDKLIEDELKTRFSNDQIPKNLHVLMENWTKGDVIISNSPKDVRFITSENIRELLTEEDRKINATFFQGHLSRLNRLSDFNFNFNNSVTIENLNSFLNSNMKVLYISTKYKLLTCVKIHNHLKSSCIITQLSFLIGSTSNNLIKSFANKFCDHRLLMIECDVNKMNNLVRDELINTLISNKNKQLIFIGTENNRFSAEFARKFTSDNKYQKFLDEEFILDQITEDSQTEFRKKCTVKFQGCSIRLNEISNFNIEKIIIGHVLMKFLKGKEFEIGEPNNEMEEIQRYYINRKFVSKIGIDKNSCAFVFGEDNSFSNNWKYTHIENTAQRYISQDEISYIENHKNKMTDSKTCILRKERENLYLLHKCSDLSLESRTVEEIIEKTCNRKVTLLSSNPGMGKTFVFNYLYHQTKINNPTLWVSKIDLNSSSKFLKEILYNKKFDSSLNKLMLFLYNSLNINSIERELFQNFLSAGKVVLFFDGFDEISPTYKSVTIELIKTLNEYSDMNRIFISSRPHDNILNSIFETFDVSSYELIPFSETDQMKFLRKFWEFNLDFDIDDDKFNSFANELIRSFKKSVNNSNADFLETPLHTMMIASTFKKYFEAFIDSESQTGDKSFLKNLSQSLNLSSLYENFIRIKCYEVLYSEKNKLDITTEISQNMIKSFHEEQIRKYQLLSLTTLFDDCDLNLILDEEERNILKLSQTEIDRIGIVIFKDNHYHFIHKTYAEYFAAIYVVHHMNRESVVKLFSFQILKEENKMVCSFVNELLYDLENKTVSNIPEMKNVIENKLGTEIHYAIRNNWQEIVKYLLKNDVNLTHVDYNNETVLHLASNSNQFILKMVLEKIESISENFKEILQKKTNDLKETPLLLIARYGTLSNIMKIFDILKINNLENELICVNRDNNNILHYTLLNQNMEALPFVVKQLKRQPEILESLIHSKGYKGRSPFLLATRKGNIESIRLLFDTMKDFGVLDAAMKSVDSDNNTILHLAAGNENAEVLPFVVEQLKNQPEIFEILIHSKGYRSRTPLQRAALRGTIKNIRLFFNTLKELSILDAAVKSVDKNKDTILHLAVQNENVEVLPFLVDQLKRHQPEIFELLIQSKGYAGRSPLLFAAAKGSIASIRLIFNSLKDLDVLNTAINSVDNNNDTILHFAAVNENIEALPFVVEQLIHEQVIFKLLIQSKDLDGDSPLLIAVGQGTIANIRLLLNKLRDLGILDDAVKSVDDDNHTIIHLAVTNDKDEVLPFVIEYLKYQPEIFESLIVSRDCKGRSPLLYAAREGKITNVRFLFNALREFDLLDDAMNSIDSENNNILHLAAANGKVEVLPFVVEHLKHRPEILSSFIQRKGYEGCSPLLFAVQYGNVANVRCLISTLRDFNLFETVFFARDIFGKNISELAALNPNPDVLQYVNKEFEKYSDLFISLHLSTLIGSYLYI